MYDVAINTMAFEFACTNQTTAEKIQHEMLHYTAPALNGIIEKIFAETDVKESYTINKVEIDLGEINVEKFGNYEMLEKFSDCLLKQLRDQKNTSSGRETSSAYIVDRLEKERQITEEFLLSGDVPWWIDKKSDISIAKVIRRVLQRSPATIKDILNNNRYNRTALKRIAVYLKPEVLERYIELKPSTFNDSIRDNLFSNIQFPALDFMAESGDFIRLSVSDRSKTSDIALRKNKLIGRLLQLADEKLINKIVVLNVFSESELNVIQPFFNAKNNNKFWVRRLGKLLEKLSHLQVEFLLFVAKKYFNNSKEDQQVNESFFATAVLNSSSNYNIETLSGSTIIEKTREIEKHDELPQQQKLNNIKGVSQIVTGDIEQAKKVINQQQQTNSIEEKENVRSANFKEFLHPDKKQLKQILTDTNHFVAGKEDADIEHVVKEPRTGNVIEGSDKVVSQEEALQSSEFLTEEPDKAITLSNKVKNNSGEQHVQPPNKITTHTLQESVVEFDKSDNISEDEKGLKSVDSIAVETQHLQSEKRLKNLLKNKQIAFLKKCLQSNHPDIFDTLYEMNENELSIISKKFKKYKNEEKRTHKNINSIIDHNYFLKYQLLQTVAFLSTDQTENEDVLTALKAIIHHHTKNKVKTVENFLQKARVTRHVFFSAIKNMSDKEVIVINDVLEKKNYSTNSERKIITNFLGKLPKESIELLKFLTSLPEEEIEQVNKIITNNISRSEIQKTEKDGEKVQRKVYIDNGGICLVAMYFTGLFNHLKYIEKNVFKNKFLAARAMYLLQYLVEGKQKNAEYLLQINKILCGFDVDESLPANIRLTKKEKSEADTMLAAVIENWTALKNTSLQGFRDSFLHRKAILTENKSYWTMQVERKGHDILLNTIPWNYHMVKFSWMKKMIKVEW